MAAATHRRGSGSNQYRTKPAVQTVPAAATHAAVTAAADVEDVAFAFSDSDEARHAHNLGLSYSALHASTFEANLDGHPVTVEHNGGLWAITEHLPEPVHLEQVSVDTVRSEWVDLSEGRNGEYNPNDPNDDALLRFDIYARTTANGEWIPVDDHSYCTGVPVDIPAVLRLRALTVVHLNVVDDFPDSEHAAQSVSWIDHTGAAVSAYQFTDVTIPPPEPEPE